MTWHNMHWCCLIRAQSYILDVGGIGYMCCWNRLSDTPSWATVRYLTDGSAERSVEHSGELGLRHFECWVSAQTLRESWRTLRQELAALRFSGNYIYNSTNSPWHFTDTPSIAGLSVFLWLSYAQVTDTPPVGTDPPLDVGQCLFDASWIASLALGYLHVYEIVLLRS